MLWFSRATEPHELCQHYSPRHTHTEFSFATCDQRDMGRRLAPWPLLILQPEHYP